MAETKFTPGPWRVLTIEQDCRMVAGKIGYTDTETNDPVVVAEVNNYVGAHKHDAHLIAQAPAMYDEIKNTIRELRSIERKRENSCGSSILIDRLERTLAKARGENHA